MWQKIFILSTFLFISITLFAQKNVTISGFVEDAQTGERLIGASVFETNWHKYGTFTNEYGYYSLTLPKGRIKLHVSYVGYKPLDTILNLNKDLNLTFKLHSATMIEQVVVTSYRNQVQSSQTGKIDVPLQQIRNLPVIFGEADLLKSLQLLPGVSSGTDGTSGIYVRGGSPGQNLILLDGVPMYNVMHLGGFFSVFTPEAIKEVTLYKSGFPARFGGRLSSVIDVRMKDGNMNKYSGSVSVGIISSKFTFEGPTVKGKGSFIVAARRTYIDVLAKPFLAMFGTVTDRYGGYVDKTSFSPGYYFYDLFAKVNHKITPKDRLFFSLYMGQDKAYIKTNETITNDSTGEKDYSTSNGNLSWGNYIFAFRWNHAFNKKLFSDFSLTYSKFFFANSIVYQDTSYIPYTNYIQGYKSNFQLAYNLGINDYAANLNFTYAPNTKHYMRFGLQAIHHTFYPGYVSVNIYESQVDSAFFSSFKFDTVYANNFLQAPEFAAYYEDDFDFTHWLKLNLGLRLSMFSVRQKNFISLEPRISGRVLINKNLSIKASYAQMTQYLHLVTNNTVGLPLDLWLPATDKVLPEHSWQVAGALTWLAPKNFSVNIEAYYKMMHNIVEIKEGNSVFSMTLSDVAKTWEDKVSLGKGWSYGAELLIRKDFGKITGWLGYTLSWSWRQFDDINNGFPFPFKYDRRHDLDIALNYKLKKGLTLGAVFVYGSGTPITIAQLQYPTFETVAGGIGCYSNYMTNAEKCYFFDVINYYGGRNGFRLPSYQRLDLSINWNKPKKHGIRTWTLGIYNLYNHINPFYTTLDLEYDPKTDQMRPALYVYSLFPVMPFISYKFTWK